MLTGSIIEDVVFLKGRPPLTEYLAYIAQNDVDGSTLLPGDLAAEWRLANERIRELEASEAGIADSPPLEPLPSSLQAQATRFLHDPIIRRSFGLVPSDVKLIDLNRLVVFQKQINLPFAHELALQLSRIQTDEELFDFTLPLNKPRPPVKVARLGPNAFAITSPSMDFRALDAPLLDPSKVINYDVGGVLSGLVGVAFGYGPNVLQAVSYKNRLILGNGSHRAYALHEAGRTMVPCLVLHATHEEELAILLPVVAQKPSPYLEAPRPPMLKDFFEEPLRRVVHVPRKVRQVRVILQTELTDSPG